MTEESRDDELETRIYAVLGNRLMDGGRDWRLPRDGGPGQWMPEIEGELKPWNNAYQLCRGTRQLLEYFGPDIYLAEFDGEIITGKKAIHARRVRLLAKTAWDERAARLFAIDCAERVLAIFEKVYPGEDRPRLGLEAARAYVDGKIDRAALRTVAKGVSAAYHNARIEDEDLHWGSTFEDIQRHSEAGSPKTIALWAVGAVSQAVATGEHMNASWTSAHSAGSAAAKACLSVARGGGPLPDEGEKKWQAGRLLEYLELRGHNT